MAFLCDKCRPINGSDFENRKCTREPCTHNGKIASHLSIHVEQSTHNNRTGGWRHQNNQLVHTFVLTEVERCVVFCRRCLLFQCHSGARKQQRQLPINQLPNEHRRKTNPSQTFFFCGQIIDPLSREKMAKRCTLTQSFCTNDANLQARFDWTKELNRQPWDD